MATHAAVLLVSLPRLLLLPASQPALPPTDKVIYLPGPGILSTCCYCGPISSRMASRGLTTGKGSNSLRISMTLDVKDTGVEEYRLAVSNLCLCGGSVKT